ncbi:MAG: hypothetical protein JWO14_3038 [Solirubrobacterales bacterium]|nr:hypothetical protein [Solirubrobacterales bacterium]
MSVPARRISVDERERTILEFVRAAGEGGASVKDIYTGVGEQLGDEVTIQAYYKLLARMQATGRLEEAAADDGERRFVVAPYLHPETALSLDDVYALMEELEPTDAIARVIDAREYFDERRKDTLVRAAEALLEEDPRELMIGLLLDRARELEADVEMLASAELRDPELEGRVRGQLKEFHRLAYRMLGISRRALDAPYELVAPHTMTRPGPPWVRVDEALLRAEISERVFGERVIELIDVNGVRDREEWNRTAVAGTDGSTYASVLQINTAQGFIDDVGSQIVTFNNSVAYVQPGASQRLAQGERPYYSVPMSRSAIDDKSNRGMVMAHFMYRYLSESEYEHMAKCATDVVQWRADKAVFSGDARAIGTGATLPKPRVHFRDGTITPQEREYGHYSRDNAYGDMVREGISLSRDILDRVRSAPAPVVFAGAVKTTQAQLFATVLNWYISRGSVITRGEPIDAGWDLTRAAHIADNEAMSLLLSTLNDRLGPGQHFVTFQVMRPFHSLTEYYYRGPEDHDAAAWVEFFRKKQGREEEDYQSNVLPQPPWLTQFSDLEDENYVFMCGHADYVSFYIGHTGGDPAPVAPRYEFMESLRAMGREQASERVERNVRLIVGALDRTGLSADRDHNFMSRKMLVKIIPAVVFNAHEMCKALGRQLDTELRSIILANLQGIRRAKHLPPGEAQFLPMSVRRYVERYRQALGRHDEDESPPQR